MMRTCCLLLALTSLSFGAEQPPTPHQALATALEIPEWSVSPPAFVGNASDVSFDDAAWQRRTLPWDWTDGRFGNDPSQPPSGSFNQVNWKGAVTGRPDAWFRTSIAIPAAWLGRETVLELGSIGDADTVWFNGERIGGVLDPLADRSYRIPTRLLRATDNTVAIHVRHAAPTVQMAHRWWFWNHREMGEPFWPAGIHEQTPRVRLVSQLEQPLPSPPHFADPVRDKKGPPPDGGVRIDITADNGASWQHHAGPLPITVTVAWADDLPTEVVPDAVRVTVLDIDAQRLSDIDLPLTADATTRQAMVAATPTLPGPGWFRITATQLRAGQPLTDIPLGGRYELDAAVLPPTSDKLMPDSMFGLCIASPDKPAISAMAAVGARWIRWDLPWDRIEPSEGRYRFNDHEQVWGGVREMQARQLCMMPVFGYCALWNVHPEVKARDVNHLFSPPHDPEAFGRAAGKMASEFKGIVHAYEIWNEPSLGRFLQPVEGMSPARTYLERVFPQAATAIRAADPEARIIFSAQWGEVFSGAKKHLPQIEELVDAVSIHPYANDEPELGLFATKTTNAINHIGVASRGTWHRDDEADGAAAWFAPARPGGPYRIWNTETGWFQAGDAGELKELSSGLTRRRVAAYIPRAHCASAWRGVERFFYFGHEHLFNRDSTVPKPAAAAYATMTAALEGTTPAFLIYPRRGLPCYVWQDNADPHLFTVVMWSQSLDWLIHPPEAAVVTDLFGRPGALDQGWLRLNEEALYLRLRATSPEACRQLLLAMPVVGLGSGSPLRLWQESEDGKDWLKRLRSYGDHAPVAK